MSNNLMFSSVGCVLGALTREFQNENPDLKVVYSENLDYENSVKMLRARFQKEGINSPILPLFAFNRQVLKHMAPVNKRTSRIKAIDLENNIKMAVLYADIDVNFDFYTVNTYELENAESNYLMERAISSIKKFNIVLPRELQVYDQMEYVVNYNLELTDKKFQHEETWYKAISGDFTIRGPIVAIEGPVAIVKEIRFRLLDMNNGFLFSERDIPLRDPNSP